MAVSIAVQLYDSPTSTGLQSITNTNFGGGTPEGYLMFQSGHIAANDPGDTPDCRISLGAGDGPNERANGATSLDNQAATDSYLTELNQSASVRNKSPGAAVFLGATFDISSDFVANGMEINWTTVQAAAYRGFVVYFGGADLDIVCGTIDLGTGTSPLTHTPGFAADVVFFYGGNGSSVTVGADRFANVSGIATSDGTQKCIAWSETDAVAAGGQPSQVILSNKCFAQQSLTASTQDYTVTASNFTATSFDVTPSANAGSDKLGYLAIRFGGKLCKLWDFSTPTSTGNVSDTTPAFLPEFGMIFGTNLEAMDAGQFNDNLAGGLGISAFTATDKCALSWYIDATADPTNTGSDAKTKALQIGNGTTSAGVVADLVSLDSNGWTLNYSAVQGNAKKAFAFAVGAVAPTAYEMDAEAGAFTLTGQDVGLTFGGAVGAGVGSFILTGQSVGLLSTRRLAAEAGSFTLTGQAVGFRSGFSMAADAGNYFLTGQPVDLHAVLASGLEYLPRASAGLNYTLYVRSSQGFVVRSADTIYDGSSTGTTLTSTDVGAILKLISPGRGLWFVSHKTGSWTLA